MKFRVTMKDPDTLHDAIRAAIGEEVAKLGLPDDEAKEVQLLRAEKVRDVCRTWFKWGEYLTIEIDTEARTATVCEASA